MLENATVPAAPMDVDALTQTSILDIAVGLFMIIGFILALAWMVKRFKLHMVVQGPLKTIAVSRLSHQAQVMLVVDGQQYLLGVTPQQVNLIDKLDVSVQIYPASHTRGFQKVSPKV